jgi:hypothetical protein
MWSNRDTGVAPERADGPCGGPFPRSDSLEPSHGGCVCPKAPVMAAVERRASRPGR